MHSTLQGMFTMKQGHPDEFAICCSLDCLTLFVLSSSTELLPMEVDHSTQGSRSLPVLSLVLTWVAEDMQQDAIDCAAQAMEKYNIEKDIAAYIKKEFDKKYNPTWHCIVGRNFGSYVTHETKHFIYFYLGQVAILLFKSG
eukprot:762407-Hanusia_phi.AAC.1